MSTSESQGPTPLEDSTGVAKIWRASAVLVSCHEGVELETAHFRAKNSKERSCGVVKKH